MPFKPSNAAASPAFIEPLPASFASSQWSNTGRLNIFEYLRAVFIRDAFSTERPSSEIAQAPA